jgi:hypothetical protein
LHVNGSAYATDDTASASVSAAAVIWILIFEPFLSVSVTPGARPTKLSYSAPFATFAFFAIF